jgi:hypothetical protein
MKNLCSLIIKIFGVAMSIDVKDFVNTKNGRILLGHIITMLKGIEFIEKPKTFEEWNKLNELGYEQHSSFLINAPPQHFLSVHLAWKRRSLEAEEIIADKFILYFDELSIGDRKAFCKVIQETIKNTLFRSEIFNVSKLSEINNSLFSILSSDNPINSVETLFYVLYFKLKDSLANWIVIYPMLNVLSKSFELGFDGIHIYDPKDESTWEKITVKYENAKFWHPSQTQSSEPNQNGIKEPKFNFTQFPDSTWLICENKGTCDGARENAAVKMKTFIAVLFSHSYLLSNILAKNSTIPHTYCKQFSADGSQTGVNEMSSSIGEIIPPILDEIILSDEIRSKLVNWYEKRERLKNEERRRVQTASQFLHYGIVATNLETFIHFFIVLDSLFGERHKVEAKITEGIQQIFPNDEMWNYKIQRLFDLSSHAK